MIYPVMYEVPFGIRPLLSGAASYLAGHLIRHVGKGILPTHISCINPTAFAAFVALTVLTNDVFITILMKFQLDGPIPQGFAFFASFVTPYLLATRQVTLVLTPAQALVGLPCMFVIAMTSSLLSLHLLNLWNSRV